MGLKESYEARKRQADARRKEGRWDATARATLWLVLAERRQDKPQGRACGGIPSAFLAARVRLALACFVALLESHGIPQQNSPRSREASTQDRWRHSRNL